MERKFVVFESYLRQLFEVCKTCYSPCKASIKFNGTLISVYTSCPAGHMNRWDSQPYINGRGAGNLLLTSMVLFTGASPTKTLRLFRMMNIQVFSVKTYFNYQREILVPAAEEVIMMTLVFLYDILSCSNAVFNKYKIYGSIPYFSIAFYRCGQMSRSC